MSTLAATNLKNPSSASNNIVLGTDGSSTLSTAKITTLADSAGANTSTPAEIASGRAKAWVNFNGTGTVSIRASYNVSSITDNGVGDYTVNFTNAMADANYGVVITGDSKSTTTVPSTNGGYIAALNRNAVPTAAAVRVETFTTGALTDTLTCNVSIFR